MGALSDHDHHRSAAGAHRGRLVTVLGMVLVLLVVEVSVAAWTGSLALFSDAGHLATDVVGLSLALGAVTAAASRPPTSVTSFGWYRLEILAALANALLLFGVAAVVLVGAVRRLGEPVHVDAGPLLWVASGALVVNVFSAWLLRPGADASLNLEGARLEVLADAVGSIGVIVAALVIRVTGWAPIDSVVAVAIAVWLLPRAVRLARRSLRVLLQHAPHGVDVADLDRRLCSLPGVAGVHDLHVWTLTSGMDVASVHVRLDTGARSHAVHHAVQRVLDDVAGVQHATIQLEPAAHDDCCAPHPTTW